jgi:H+/Cl- antiporter ClcA
MPEDFDLRSRGYWRRFRWGLLVGLLSALGTLLFVVVMNLGISLVWPEVPGPEPFSGSVRILVIMIVAGLIVGLIHHFVEAKEVNVFGAIVKGRLDPRPVPGAILVALTSLIGGFSLGPEVPTGMVAGGLATWLSER